MGHDIYALRISDDQTREDLYNTIVSGKKDQVWFDAYEQYEEQVNVAYLRRSAFDEWNKAIYIMLDACDCYGGCSGKGDEREFTLDQFLKAREVFPEPGREPSFADGLAAKLAAEGFDVAVGSTYDSLSREFEFIDKCINYLRETQKNAITISFL